MNPMDGRLPNYGANDGAHPMILSCTDFSDFRPLVQALSVASRGERLYEPGPWDEMPAWLFGHSALDLPLRPSSRKSVSFRSSGYHVLRGNDERTFITFRCGSLCDRFSQIDMLHLDFFWRGHNVLVDAGSYLYNGAERWHRHFQGTASHNTVVVDGADQMIAHRRFKNLYWTHADLLRFSDGLDHGIAEGEHRGYHRAPIGCLHRRAVLFAKDDLLVVADRIEGRGTHRARLHWLGGPYPHRHDDAEGRMVLQTPVGEVSVTVFDAAGQCLPGDVVAGSEHPPRGWLSRYYGEKVPAPSLAVEQRGSTPLVFVTVVSVGPSHATVARGRWRVEAGSLAAEFALASGCLADVTIASLRVGMRAYQEVACGTGS
jgi:asparagine synthase (glutamine-hydrolysing)